MIEQLSIHDVVCLGNHLKNVRELVHRLLQDAPANYPLGREAAQMLCALDRLRSSLDAEFRGLLPASRDPRGLSPFIFNGRERLSPRPHAPGEFATDTFASWCLAHPEYAEGSHRRRAPSELF
jgi:hypothetical protein